MTKQVYEKHKETIGMTDTIVQTRNGKVLGKHVNGVGIFQGIPYAKPPVGALRFAPPQPPEDWEDVRPCYLFSDSATQAQSQLINMPPSEDCLYLNVWAPQGEDLHDLPVMMWIHGGGFYNGCGSMPYYDGYNFARDGVICVTINYRLGALGFLPLQTLMDEYGTTGNWGTLDQIAALQWIHDNIAAFGGDPNNVTIDGESAGSFSVSNLIMSPKAKGLFNRAIMESGSILSNFAAVPYTKSNLEASIKMGEEYAKSFGVYDTKEGLERLRSMDAMTLYDKAFFSSDATIDAPFAMWPVFDGSTLPKDPLAALKAGSYNKTDVLMGYNANEGLVFLSEGTTPEGITRYMKQTMGSQYEEVMKHYAEMKMTNPFEIVIDFITNVYFKSGMNEMENIMTRNGQNVFAYEFAFTPDGNFPLRAQGSTHSIELLYVWDTMAVNGLRPGPFGKDVMNQMHRNWVNFMTTGNPNTGMPLPSDVEWKKFDPSNQEIFHIANPMSMQKPPKLDEIEFYNKLLYR